MWSLTAIALVVGGLAGYFAAQRRRRVDCPSCSTPLVTLAALPEGEPARAYDVLACRRCVNTLVAVHGGDWPWAVCPRCEHRSLQVVVTRASGDVEHPVRVTCDESCPLCGHRALVELPSPPPRRGTVIAFPGTRPPRR